MKAITPILILLTMVLPVTLSANASPDSVGMKKVNGRNFLMHKVTAGETLYALSRNYGISVSDIMAANPDQDLTVLSVDQIILVPYRKEIVIKAETSIAEPPSESPAMEAVENKQSNPGPTTLKKAKLHEVKPGETLYAISKKYGITVDNLVEWNSLKDLGINVGQQLIVGYADVLNAPEENLAIKVDREKEEKERKEKAPKTEKWKADDTVVNPTLAGDVNELSLQYMEQLTSGNFYETDDQAIAMFINDPGNTMPYYYALHKDLRVGTIIKVTNLINGRFIYAKVIGTLPQKPEDNTALKLPKTAQQDLRIFDERLMVAVSSLSQKRNNQ